ncbi:MAG: aspartyl protease, partial [Chloroflexi bacterium]|nr:aspartyl protease [Chloroflexota bacterium]
IFGEEGDSNLLGATTLESLGLILDPLKRELRPLPMVL